MNQGRDQEALRVFDRMAQQQAIYVEAKAFGFAGKAICLKQLNRIPEAEQAAADASRTEFLNALREADPEFAAMFEAIRGQLTGQT